MIVSDRQINKISAHLGVVGSIDEQIQAIKQKVREYSTDTSMKISDLCNELNCSVTCSRNLIKFFEVEKVVVRKYTMGAPNWGDLSSKDRSNNLSNISRSIEIK